jgi:hypothetical protein
MIKSYLTLLFLIVFGLTGVLAQKNARNNKKIPKEEMASSPKIALHSGINMHVGRPVATYFIGVEYGLSHATTLYVQAGSILRSDLDMTPKPPDGGFFFDPTKEAGMRPGSFEIGVGFRQFLVGHLSGRRSSIFCGPDIRYSKRNYRFGGSDPNTGVSKYQNSSGFAIRGLFHTGWQHRFGRGLAELSLPLGFEVNKTNLVNFNNDFHDPFGGFNVLFLPTISLGYILK